MMKRICSLLTGLLLLVSGASLASAATLQKTTEKALTKILTSLEILHMQHLSSGLIVRVFRITDMSECDPDREWRTCPRSQLLIVFSPGEGVSEPPVLWRTARLIGWDFVRATTPTEAGPNSLGEVGFEVKVCEAPPRVEKGEINPRIGGWWKEKRYEIRVGATSATITPLPAYEDTCSLY
jgi:hypothetical protein